MPLRRSLPGFAVCPQCLGVSLCHRRLRITLGAHLRDCILLKWGINDKESPLLHWHLVAPVVTWALDAHTERGWPPGRVQVWIRKLFPSFEAERREPRVLAEHRFWAQAGSRVSGRASIRHLILNRIVNYCSRATTG